MEKFIIFLIVVISIVLGAGAYYYLSLPPEEEPLPQYASQYHITDAECRCKSEQHSDIVLTFQPSEKAVNNFPQFEIKEIPQQAQTKVIFYNIGDTDISFIYENVVSNPLISEIDYQKKEDSLTLSIHRKGSLVPAETIKQESQIIFRLPAGEKEYPKFTLYQPDDDSKVYPSKQNIRVFASLSAPLKEAFVFFEGKPVDFQSLERENNQYVLEFSEVLSEDSHYQIKVVVKDQEDRFSATVWDFEAQMPTPRSDLTADRFKYLGWWGQINANQVSVRTKPTTQSEQLDTFSTANRIKVLNEVNGESIDSNNLWYQIDGGKHPGAYIFSRYVTPIEQPQLPEKVKIPSGVESKERWIDVNLTDNILTLFEYDKPIFVTYVSTGRQENPTITGDYHVWFKAKKDRMTDGPPAISYRYDLVDVPHVFYYYGSYAIHGTYWHDKFGTYQSAGCTNLTQGDAKFIFEQTKPQLGPEQNSLRIERSEDSTLVHNHY